MNAITVLFATPLGFLANLKDDPSEKVNLAERHADIVTRLRELHQPHLD